MTIIARITTSTLQRFEFEIPAANYEGITDEESRPEVLAYNWLRWEIDGNEGVIMLPGRIIDLGNDGRNALLDIILVPDEGAMPPPDEVPENPDIPQPFGDTVPFLNQKLELYGYMLNRKEGKKVILLYEVNNRPVLDVLSRENAALAAQALISYEAGDTILIPPVQPQDEADAVQYLMEYVAEEELPGAPQERTGRAVPRELFD